MRRLDIRGGSGLRRACALLAMAAPLACGSDKTTGPPGGGGMEHWVSAATRSWTIPAQTDGYKCHVELAATDKYYTGFRLASPSAAQTELFLEMRPSAAQTGDFDCTSANLLGGEAIYAAGPGTTPLTFASGKGVHVAAGQYVVMIVHVSNSTASPVTASTTIEARVGAASDVTTPMDMFFVGRPSFAIPASGDSVAANTGCSTSADVHIVAEIPIMRSLGIHSSVQSRDPSSAIHTIFDAHFDPQHIDYTTLGSDFLLPGSSFVNGSCSYVNNTGSVVNFGESASDEICFLGLYRYPPKPPTNNSPIDCELGIPI